MLNLLRPCANFSVNIFDHLSRGGGGALTFGKGRGVCNGCVAPKSETIPLRTEVAYEPRGLRTKRPSDNIKNNFGTL